MPLKMNDLALGSRCLGAVALTSASSALPCVSFRDALFVCWVVSPATTQTSKLLSSAALPLLSSLLLEEEPSMFCEASVASSRVPLSSAFSSTSAAVVALTTKAACETSSSVLVSAKLSFDELLIFFCEDTALPLLHMPSLASVCTVTGVIGVLTCALIGG